VREGLEAVAGSGSGGFDDVVKEQVPLLERVVRTGELHQTAPVLLAEFRQAVGGRCRWNETFWMVTITISFLNRPLCPISRRRQSGEVPSGRRC
jgi:hypothetical protein